MQELIIKDFKNLNDFLDSILDKEKQKILNQFYFRGQSNKAWKLETSLTRLIIDDEMSIKKAKYYEIQSIREFKAIFQLAKEKFLYTDMMEDLGLIADMQHFSCPTRFLDWTCSPYVALYFAVCEDFHNDGALFIWDYLNYLTDVKEHHSGFKDMSIAELIELQDFDYVQILLPTKKNERMYRQQGVFSASNNLIKSHCEILDEFGKEISSNCGITKVIIPMEMKMELLDRLRYMNITANTLFSSSDSIGKEIRESLLLRKWKEKINFA